MQRRTLTAPTSIPRISNSPSAVSRSKIEGRNNSMSSSSSHNAITVSQPPATSPATSHSLLSRPLSQSLRCMFTTTSNSSSIFQGHLGPQPPSMCLARPSFNTEPPSLHLHLVEYAMPIVSPRTRKIFSVKVNRMPCTTIVDTAAAIELKMNWPGGFVLLLEGMKTRSRDPLCKI